MRGFCPTVFLLLPVLLLTGCVYPLDDPRSGAGTGGLVLSFNTGTAMSGTKADGSLDDGLEFENLLVILTDESGKVIKNSNLVPADGGMASMQEIEFLGLPPGNYHAYAYANITQTAWQNANSLLANTERSLREGVDFLNVDHLMKTLSPGETLKGLKPEEAPMLLTGDKAVSVGIQVNRDEVELLQPVVRFNVFVYNHTMYPIHLKSLTFNDFNMPTAYLIGRFDNGVPVIPQEALDNPCALPAYDEPDVSDPDYWIVSDASQLVYSELLYESTAVNYKLYATMTMDVQDQGGQSIETKEKSIQYKGAELMPVSKILGMSVDDRIPVLMTTPNNSEGLFVGWNATAGKNVYKQATATDEASYQKWAQEILNDPVERAKYELILHKTREETTTEGIINYYRLYHKEGNNEVLVLPQEEIIITEGTRSMNTESNSTYVNPPGFVHHLARIWNNWGKNKQVLCPDGKLPNTTLKFKADKNDSAFGNRRWAFYEVDPEGTVMKLIDNKTNQVTRLSQMVRNQELNVVINVYYGVEIGDFDFKIENKFWSGGEREHSSRHTFE